MRLLATLAMLCAIPAACQDAAVEPYTGFYTGRIQPTPQEVEYDPGAWVVADCREKKSGACILVSPDASEPERTAAAQIAARIRYLSDGAEPVMAPENQRPRDAQIYIALGIPDTSRFIQGHLRACGVTTPDQPEGYAIAAYEHEEGLRGILLSGRDGAGVFFGAQSLVQMMERKGDEVVLHPVSVRDWPTYELRSFKTGGAYDPGEGSRQMGLWAPFARFNCYNICYTTLGVDKWVNPPAEYREHVTLLTRHMRARGLDCMPFVNPYYLWKEHIETSDEGDLVKLFEACRIGPDAGGTRVMLCLDDFASEPQRTGPALYIVRSERDRARFGDDLAAVNIAMVNDLAGRLRAAHPDCKLYVVLPYYWNPDARYREAAEAYLRAVAAGLDPQVRIVWTGPRVRSAVITDQQVDYYQSLLGGRKVMLWDNTLYMHHNPPHYFLDTFHTRYPDRFWELMSGEVHLNAGSGEAYKCGLLAAANYLWNPAAYDPEASLRNAVAMLAGPEHVDDLLAFRDIFYTVYDEYASQFGKPEQFLARVKEMTQRPFDDDGIREVQDLLDREQALADKLAAQCPNEGLVEEVRERVATHAPYREAFEALAKLPPMSEEDGANIAPDPTVEEVTGGRPAHWATYTGAGRCALSVAEGRGGGNCGRLVATELHDWQDGRTSINVALMIGRANGFTGPEAPEVLPLHRYYFRFWLKGTAPRVTVAFVTWDAAGTNASRGFARIKLEPFAAPADWTCHHGSFITAANAQRGALKIGIEGYDSEGGGLGEICVDDVYVGRSKARALEGVPGE